MEIYGSLENRVILPTVEPMVANHETPTDSGAAAPSRGLRNVVILSIGIILAVIPIAVAATRLYLLQPPINLPWWLIAPAFVLAEYAVVHFRFRRDAHSFSMSEIPLVAGLFFATVPDLITAMAVGSLFALVVIRHQPVTKLLFNVAQFTAQATIAALVFNVIAQGGPTLGVWTWAGALLATIAAFLVAHALVTTVIRVTGGRLAAIEVHEALVFGLVGTVINTSLALVSVTLFWVRPDAAWLALVPLVVLFVAYRVFTEQRDERSRTQAMYDFTLALHGAPALEDALPLAVNEVCRMFEVEAVHIVITEPERGTTFRTSAYSDGVVEPLSRISLPGKLRELFPVESQGLASSAQLDALGIQDNSSVVWLPIEARGEVAGVIIVGEALSSVAELTEQDLKILKSISERVALTLENDALQSSLVEVTKLSEELEEVVRSKDRFIATISHELRNPLTGVIGLTQQLKEHRELLDDVEIEEFLTMIHDGSVELGGIIDDLLVAARADLESLVVRASDFYLDESVASLLRTGLARAEGKIIDRTVAGSAPAVSADPMRVRQIVRNLVTNAVRYGGDRIHFEVRQSGPLGILAVIDDGPGVPAGAAEMIFEPYGTVATTEHAESVGLGLSVSRQLARRMGGDLIYRRVDDCTRFELSVPLA